MPILGALWSQQLGFTITTTTGTVYTHGLGFTPTVIILTTFGTAITPGNSVAYTGVNTNVMTILTTGAAAQLCDVTVGSFHSLIK